MGRRLFQIVHEDVVETNVEDIALDDDLSTNDLSKDEAAIEEISATLDKTIQTQNDLVQQDIANNNIELPKEEDVKSSELAIESAIEKLGISREELGIHAKTLTAFSVSKEGVKEMIYNIAKTIKELIKKIVRFFKELWTKLRMKLGNYRGKVDNLVSALKSISEKNKKSQAILTDKIFLDSVYKDLKELKLVNTKLFVQDKKGNPLRLSLNSVTVADEMTKWITSISDTIISGKKKGWFSKDKDWSSDIKSALENAKIDRSVQFCDRPSLIIGDTGSAFVLGGSGESIHFLEILYSPKDHPGYPSINIYPVPLTLDKIKDMYSAFKDNPTALIASGILAKLFKDITDIFKSSVPYPKDYQPVVDSFIDNANEIKRAIDDAPSIFSNVENLQKALEGVAIKLEKSSVDNEDSDVSTACVQLAKYIKTVSSNLLGSIVKVYFSTIRDYLVIGNVIVKNALGNTTTK